MFRFIKQLLLHLQGETIRLLVFAGVLLLGWGTVAPVGTLVWWLREGSKDLGLSKNQTRTLSTADNPSSRIAKSKNINCYIVFLPGVGDFSANQLTKGEEFFLNRLAENHPNCVAVRDVFPYSAANESLGGRRLLAPLWRAAEEADGWLKNADVLIKIRNLWRFAISADERYGPIYNQGIATAIVDRMNAAHPIERSHNQPLKIILIGTSGGVQVALGAAPYLNRWLNSKLIVVSIGGCFDGDTGFESVNHVYQLNGRQDWIEDITRVVFASNWSWVVGSPFNQARRQGRYTVLNTGPHTHDGAKGYFGTAYLPAKKTTYVELTLQKVNQLPIWSKNIQTSNK
ncbi:MAG: hypothetical protein SAK29_22425 [Scytonema sp. PMC 1069.18]|nr:hypothetical protein [Scytonema sp. PMC 1069.18]MEC4882359.1 hypothetical protein [Scytonema sp. PMC 1070.18]